MNENFADKTTMLVTSEYFNSGQTFINSISTKEFRVNLVEHLSFENRNGIEMYFLNLDRSIKQSDVVELLPDDELVRGISLAHNYLLQMPKFVSNLTNLIEINAKFNELYDVDFLLHSDSIDDQRSKTRPLVHPFLEHIHLSHNHIQSLPSTLHYLRFLRTLDLSYNYLTKLPTEFSSLEQLEVLRLNNNQLTELPRTFANLIHLKILNLSSNQLQSIDMMKNLSNLREINVDSNPLKTFPRLLSSCSNLEIISFAKTNLSNLFEINFEYFHQFIRLKCLDLSKNHLENSFFLSEQIRSWPMLERLNLEENQLSNLNMILFQLKSLNYLNLSHNCFTRLPKDLPMNLIELRLSSNQIEIFSDDCFHLKHIVHLDLDHNQIEHLPDEFLQILQIRFLNISFNPLSSFPDILLRLKTIEHLICQNHSWRILPAKDLFQRYFSRTLKRLDLSHHQLKSSLNELTVLKMLTHLNLSFNHLETLDDDFRYLTCLESLKLSHNKFQRIPTCLVEMSNHHREKYIGETLVELHLNNNQLKTLPEDFIHLINLQSLDLSNNSFPSFPESIVFLEQLTFLAYSQTSGIHIATLPDNFNNLSQLKKLILSSNSFAEVPSAIYHLKKLIYLDLSDNLLTGIEINRLSQLKTLKLNGNYFSSFPLALYRIESFDIDENSFCLAPPIDLHYKKTNSAAANRFVELNDQHDEKLFHLYKEILIEYLSDSTIERLLIRLKLSLDDIEEFRMKTKKSRRKEKIELLFQFWKEKRDTLVNAETLLRLMKIIGDKRILQQMQKATISARMIRI